MMQAMFADRMKKEFARRCGIAVGTVRLSRTPGFRRYDAVARMATDSSGAAADSLITRSPSTFSM